MRHIAPALLVLFTLATCTHQGGLDAEEPLFMEEEPDQGYVMLEDQDVGISEKKKDPLHDRRSGRP